MRRKKARKSPEELRRTAFNDWMARNDREMEYSKDRQETLIRLAELWDLRNRTEDGTERRELEEEIFSVSGRYGIKFEEISAVDLENPYANAPEEDDELYTGRFRTDEADNYYRLHPDQAPGRLGARGRMLDELEISAKYNPGRLNLSGMGIESFDQIPLKDLRGVKYLDLSFNPLTADDLEGLETLRGLETLDLSGTDIGTLDGILPEGLKVLRIAYTSIENLSGLSGIGTVNSAGNPRAWGLDRNVGIEEEYSLDDRNEFNTDREETRKILMSEESAKKERSRAEKLRSFF